ncbi:hypothetical protein HDK64DRAFT_273681, partial [Phyllosticta capitalensis]
MSFKLSQIAAQLRYGAGQEPPPPRCSPARALTAKPRALFQNQGPLFPRPLASESCHPHVVPELVPYPALHWVPRGTGKVERGNHPAAVQGVFAALRVAPIASKQAFSLLLLRFLLLLLFWYTTTTTTNTPPFEMINVMLQISPQPHVSKPLMCRSAQRRSQFHLKSRPESFNNLAAQPVLLLPLAVAQRACPPRPPLVGVCFFKLSSPWLCWTQESNDVAFDWCVCVCVC